MKLEALVIGSFVFMAVIIGYSSVYTDLAGNYSFTATALNETFDDNTGLNALVQGTTDDIDTPTGITALASSITSSLWQTISNFLDWTGWFANLASNISSVLGLPEWVFTMIVGIIGAVFLFLTIRIFTKGDV
jgi:hypothetical protein